MLEIKPGNLLDVESGVILHQTNCMGVMGGGVALQIKEKWPHAYLEYQKHCEAFAYPFLMGTMHFSKLTDTLVLGNLFGQIAPSRGQATVYSAYPTALREVVAVADASLPIHIPYGMGCGLAGGDWDVVLPILDYWLRPFKKVTIWRYEPQLAQHLR